MKLRLTLAALCLLPALASPAAKSASAAATTPGSHDERALAAYFRAETDRVSHACVAEIRTLPDWTSRRDDYRRQLQEMLGLFPWPERTDLKPVITGKIEAEDFVVEKLQFQAMPGLYVTANLYVPRQIKEPAPTVLYVCGHARVVTNGVSCGNKAGYHHHGVWFARNGYVCLLIDTVQLGEIEGRHRGTYNEGQWWWNSRGYTPAGVEAWMSIRALDYLGTRPEVDHSRIGMTGRSGGGSYTWTVAALDERVKVAAPVAGITDLHNHVVDGTVEGHCDCMFYVNTYRWDFPTVAALLAPRPLLIANSDKDKIFPLDGVVRLHSAARRIYELYGAANKLGLLITEGPHEDTQDLQLPVFRWFNRWLKGKDEVIDMAARKCFAPEQLRVFAQLPAGELNTRIQDTFVPPGRLRTGGEVPRQGQLQSDLRRYVFNGWPEEPAGLEPILHAESKGQGLKFRAFGFDSQPGVTLWLYVLEDTKVRKPERVLLTVLDQATWTNSRARSLWLGTGLDGSLQTLRTEMQSTRSALAFFAPRGVGEKWAQAGPKTVQIRRRYMLLGQTLDGMRVWDIRCAANGLSSLREFRSIPLIVKSHGEMGVNAAYAALFEPGMVKLRLDELPNSHRSGPDYLNVLKVTDVPEVLQLLGSRLEQGQ